MCGIVGAVAQRNVVPILIEGLRKLEYRGYDSAGLALVNGAIERVRSVGRVADLEARARAVGADAPTGIAHTRWATHGGVTEGNAHPHASISPDVEISVVHNGIIENHEALRARLCAQGYKFLSQTDTEVIAHLVHAYVTEGLPLFQAVQQAVRELHGAYAIAVVSSREPNTVVGSRKGSPLLLGVGNAGTGRGENFLASDTSALLQVTKYVTYLEEGDVVEIRLDGYDIVDAAGEPAQRPIVESRLSADSIELGQYDHYMQKEIFEQPGAIANTLEMVTGASALSAGLFGAEAEEVFARTERILILACGTSYHSGLVAKYWLESVAKMPVAVEIASEYRYRDSVSLPGTLVITISQSGETADTLAALQHAQREGLTDTLTICNVPESALIRQSKLRFLTRAGPEIGVASTKAFTTQLAVLFVLTLVLAKQRGLLSTERESELLAQLRHLPAAIQRVLECEMAVRHWANRFAPKEHALFLGRGVHFPIAMEGALKLKEITYIHAEAYAAGELKHGPLALVDSQMPVVVVAPNDALIEKLKSNLQEVRVRGGELFVFADRDVEIEPADGINIINLDDHAGLLSPILHVIPLQLLAYHAALARGTDVDKPRNLAKSVTVE
ncbi:glutamine--fructose-6-phosphate transaminase (isomerizing) [Quisquiliibacterium transsilvanicum]|uniref:Glutamine--fructose-6-phosphate aminotransferase [isomerizing] n=1 Tax=Quisquiliibacterium transsilvanicum TaxID=1549638 RepID=A0A7W8HJU7_9BURK|nr:glutamine--fructose-6-phosphate transaminase (isomerizing) [Quisquiliibacterium transsilvanicum]MBB5273217.1 glucosamine--fructose-6-phosphate aminotransferase (isomerizing) [Quisquiliibacterium transsilvanicum]